MWKRFQDRSPLRGWFQTRVQGPEEDGGRFTSVLMKHLSKREAKWAVGQDADQPLRHGRHVGLYLMVIVSGQFHSSRPSRIPSFPSLIYFLRRPLIDLFKPSGLDKYFTLCSRVPLIHPRSGTLYRSAFIISHALATWREKTQDCDLAGSVTAAPTRACSSLSRWQLFIMQMGPRRMAAQTFFIIIFYIQHETAKSSKKMCRVYREKWRRRCYIAGADSSGFYHNTPWVWAFLDSELLSWFCRNARSQMFWSEWYSETICWIVVVLDIIKELTFTL